MAEGYIYLLDRLNTYSPIISVFANLLLMVATIFLAKYTKGLFEATSTYGKIVQKQTEIMKNQLELSESQNHFMKGQLSYLNEQERIMKEQAKRNINIEKYRRLRDEMDKLVMPLHIAASTIKTGKDDQNSGGIFGLIDYKSSGGRSEIRHDNYLFWLGIKRNLYLIRSKDLMQLLLKHFKLDDDYFDNRTEANRESFLKNRRELVQEIENLYPKLEDEIKQIESNLQIGK